MTLQLEEGKTYIDRSGERWREPSRVRGQHHLVGAAWTLKDGNDARWYFRKDGTFCTENGQSPHDLIAEWTDDAPPVNHREDGEFGDGATVLTKPGLCLPGRHLKGSNGGCAICGATPDQVKAQAEDGATVLVGDAQNSAVELQEGGYYNTRSEGVAGPLVRCDDPTHPWVWYRENGSRLYETNGKAYRGTKWDIVSEAPPPFDIKARIADEAKRIVSGARRSAYGTPEQNFERIARYWQAYFENTGRGSVNVTAADVSPLMRLMKEARLNENPDHYDSLVDLVGYALTGAEVNGVKPPK